MEILFIYLFIISFIYLIFINLIITSFKLLKVLGQLYKKKKGKTKTL